MIVQVEGFILEATCGFLQIAARSFSWLHTAFCDTVRKAPKLILLFALNQLLLKLSYKVEHNSSPAWQERGEILL